MGLWPTIETKSLSTVIPSEESSRRGDWTTSRRTPLATSNLDWLPCEMAAL